MNTNNAKKRIYRDLKAGSPMFFLHPDWALGSLASLWVSGCFREVRRRT
jgi:hypothetical protein